MRLQNDDLWDKYYCERRDLEKRTGLSLGNELWLMHGTSATDPDIICKSSGFDFRHSRPGYFGRGSYFAVDTAYSGAVAF
jgi:hypothetical protein